MSYSNRPRVRFYLDIRFVVRLALLALVGLLAACTSPAPAPDAAQVDAPEQPAAQEAASADVETTGSKEAPMLAAQVAAGELPPLEERLPANPMVVEPIERIGEYGGTWRTALVGGGDNLWLERTIGYDYLMRWNIEWTEAIPNIAESVDVNEEGTEFVFHLREGMKWSDGHPFTADDITFWWEDVATNSDLSPTGPPNWMITAGETGTVEKIDDSTVRFAFSAPNGLFLQTLARPAGDQATRYPRHYLEQFHIKYNEANLDQLIQENQAEDWAHLFQLKGMGIEGTPYNAKWSNADLPTLSAWKITVPYGDGVRVVAERNPYYWKVDPEGNQLPYIDSVVYDVLESVDVLVLKALNGEIDMMDRHLSSPQNKAVFIDNMEQGDYHLFETVPDSSNSMGIYLNFNHPDPVMREIIHNKDFRIGLSHAINRQEVIDLIYIGQGEPYQVASRPESPFYDEEFARQYIEYDPDLANEHLDRAGLTERDAEGFRLRPDGERLVIGMEINATAQDWIDGMELIKGYWEDVGIEMQLKVEDRSLLWTRKNNALHDAMVWSGDSGLGELLNASRYFPQFDGSHFAVRWAYWYLNPDDPEAEEPPAPTQRQMELYEQVKTTADPEEQNELMRELLQIAKEQFYLIGVRLPANGYGVVKNNFHNVPEVMFSSGSVYIQPGPTHPEQYFIEQ